MLAFVALKPPEIQLDRTSAAPSAMAMRVVFEIRVPFRVL